MFLSHFIILFQNKLMKIYFDQIMELAEANCQILHEYNISTIQNKQSNKFSIFTLDNYWRIIYLYSCICCIVILLSCIIQYFYYCIHLIIISVKVKFYFRQCIPKCVFQYVLSNFPHTEHI